MATKVDNTASQICRAHGCSLEATMDRLLNAEKRVGELEEAATATAGVIRWALEHGNRLDPEFAVAILDHYEDALKGKDAD